LSLLFLLSILLLRSDMEDACKLYVGHISPDVRERDVRDNFEKFGRILSVSMKNNYCFVVFEDVRDADEAIRGMDGRVLGRERIVVEHTHRRDSRSSAKPERSEWRIRVDNLPRGVTWPQLKDHFRFCGNVVYGDVVQGIGFIEFRYRDDMYFALDRMHDTNWFGSYIRVSRARPDDRRERDRRRRSRSPRRRSPRRDEDRKRKDEVRVDKRENEEKSEEKNGKREEKNGSRSPSSSPAARNSHEKEARVDSPSLREESVERRSRSPESRSPSPR
jgi:RNA recognition motif-containing protein